jgi:hypothetical protein
VSMSQRILCSQTWICPRWYIYGQVNLITLFQTLYICDHGLCVISCIFIEILREHGLDGVVVWNDEVQTCIIG